MTKKTLLTLLLLSTTKLFATSLATITPLESEKLLKENNAVIVDVRELDETSQGAVSGTNYIPLSLMTDNKKEFEKRITELPKDKTIIVYCRSGRRSGIMGSELQKRGFKVLNMGAFDAWKAAGLKTEEKK